MNYYKTIEILTKLVSDAYSDKPEGTTDEQVADFVIDEFGDYLAERGTIWSESFFEKVTSLVPSLVATRKVFS